MLEVAVIGEVKSLRGQVQCKYACPGEGSDSVCLVEAERVLGVRLLCHLLKKNEQKENGKILTIYIYIYIKSVPGGMDKTSGECSLC